MMNKEIKGMLLTLLAAAGFGLAAPLSKYIYSHGISIYMMLTVRFILAGVILMAYMFVNKSKGLFKIDRSSIILLFLLGGVIYVATTIFYFSAIKYIPVSIHVILFYTYPLAINIFCFVVLKEKIPFNRCIAMGFSFIGIVLIAFNGKIFIQMKGVLLSLSAAVCYGTYLLLLNHKKLHGLSALSVAFYTNVFSGISFTLLSVLTGNFVVKLPYQGLLGILVMAIFSTALAIIVLKKGIQMVGPSKASIISTFEPLEGILLSVLLLGETLNGIQIIGMILTLTGIILLKRKQRTSTVQSKKIS